MKFILISPFTSISGSAVRFWNIAGELSKRGYDVIYIERLPKDEKPRNHNIIRYFFTYSHNNLFLDILYSTIYNLIILFKNIRADAVFCFKPQPNSAIPGIVARLLGKKVFLDVDDLDYGYFESGPKKVVSKKLFDFFPRFFPVITYHTETLKNYLIEHTSIGKNKLYFLAQGVSEDFLKYNTGQISFTDYPSIVYIATLERTTDFLKVFPLLIDICKKYPDLKITIIGEGSRKKEFIKSADHHGLSDNFIFTGRIPHLRVPEIISRNWIGINYMEPTLTNNCRSILKIREYMASGIQVVCNDTGDSYLFKDFIYVEDSLEAMKNRICELVDKGPLENTKAREFLKQNYRWPVIVDNFLEYAGV